MVGWVTEAEYPYRMTEEEARVMANELEHRPGWRVVSVFQQNSVVHAPWAVCLKHLACDVCYFVREPTLEEAQRVLHHDCDRVAPRGGRV